MTKPDPSPAEKLAAKKSRRASPGKGKSSQRAVCFDCRIRDARHELKLTLAEVAASTGLCTATLHRIELGDDVKLTTARKLAAFFGKSVDELWEDLP